MYSIHEVSRRTGVTVRALQYYDRIGLLPVIRTPSGYRQYTEKDLETLRQILFFRELDFSLEEIASILHSPEYDEKETLRQQIELLTLQKQRLEGIITLAKKRLNEEETDMSFSEFDENTIRQYKEEAKKRWGNTPEYAESVKRAEGRSGAEEGKLAKGLMDLFRQFGSIRDTDPASTQSSALVRALQQYITDHYYPCSDEVLRGLGQMYVGDEAFRKNIDAAGGDGTALFVSKAIEAAV